MRSQKFLFLFFVLTAVLNPAAISQMDVKEDSLQSSFYETPSLLTPSPVFDQKRFNYALGIGAGTYSVFATGLYFSWYRQFDQSSFHFFNDWGEWENIDKYGHFYSSYFQSHLCYKGARWTGMSENKAVWTGIACSALFQTTIEVMDGFSTEWGWSWSDIGMNVAGSSAFLLQHKLWKEQRIHFKVSSWPQRYNKDPFQSETGLYQVTLEGRADALFGDSFLEKYLKDYNAQILWASFNISSFLPRDNSFPKWLNIAVGYGANNMYGGFENRWEINDEWVIVDPVAFPRYKQFYLGLDVDLTRISTKNPLLKSLFSIFNIFKAPLPAIELNTQGEFTFHLFSK